MFTKEELEKGIQEYFNSEQWKETLKLLKDPKVEHLHIFVDSCLNPYTIDEIFMQYLIKQGYHFSKKPWHGAIQDIKLSSNLEADDLLPFEVYNYYKEDTVLSPQQGREAPEFWTKQDVEDLFSQYNFKEPLEVEKEELRDYFTYSEHWKETLRQVVLEDMEHLHVNIETYIHPEIIKNLMEEAFTKEGWIVNKLVHMIFSPSRLPKDQKQWYGKIMVMLKKPEVTRFDIAWIYNPDVLIRPSQQYISNFDGGPEFDVGGTTTKVNWYISLHDFVSIDESEIKKLFKE